MSSNQPKQPQQSKQPKRAQQGTADKKGKKDSPPCPRPCALIPIDVPGPDKVQQVLHPRKDVFVLKVAKIGPNGDRHCRMELELVTPKSNEKTPPYRVDTRETQCDPECNCCTVCATKKGR